MASYVLGTPAILNAITAVNSTFTGSITTPSVDNPSNSLSLGGSSTTINFGNGSLTGGINVNTGGSSFVFINTAAATSGATLQNSNSITLRGAYWDGAASQNYDTIIKCVPLDTSPTGKISFTFNGTEMASINSHGGITLDPTDADYPYIEMNDGSGADITSGNVGRLIYNYNNHMFQISTNGSAYNNIGGISSVGNIPYLQLTSNQQTIINYVVSNSGNYIVFVYISATNTTTNVSVAASWVIPYNNTIVTSNLYSTNTLINGQYNITPLYIYASTGSITVTINADTPSNLSVSASIMEIY